MQFEEIVQRWFDEEWSGSLLLPDGWYGRPYDNQHRLTSMNELEGVLSVTLDENLTLHFEGLRAVEARKEELVFGPFDKLRFVCGSFGSDGKCEAKEYFAGAVRILSGLGVR